MFWSSTSFYPTTSLEQLDFPPCGVWNLRLSLVVNNLCLLLTRILSDLAAHHLTLFLTALRNLFFSSLTNNVPLCGLPVFVYAPWAAWLCAHKWLKVSSRNFGFILVLVDGISSSADLASNCVFCSTSLLILHTVILPWSHGQCF